MSRLKGAARAAFWTGTACLVGMAAIGLPIAAGIWLTVKMGLPPNHPVAMVLGMVLLAIEVGGIIGWFKEE